MTTPSYRLLGRTGVRVSPFCLGCMNFGIKTTVEDTCAIVDRSLEAGINFLDTANVYGRGASEEAVGEALKRNGRRDEVVLATKVHGTMSDTDPNGLGLSRRHIIASCEDSLRRLQTDWIDLYQLHRPRSDTALDETLGALDDLVRAGKVRMLGTSMFASWQLVNTLWASRELRLNRMVCEQPHYSILDRRMETELVPMALSHDIALIPFGPLAGGLLSGKYAVGEAPPEGSRYAEKGNWRHDVRRKPEALVAVTQLAELAREKGVSLPVLATGWVLQRPGVTSPIIGPRTMGQLESYLPALDLELSDEDLARIDEIVPPGGSVTAFYEPQFSNWNPRQFAW